jgi:hypothetical protein
MFFVYLTTTDLLTSPDPSVCYEWAPTPCYYVIECEYEDSTNCYWDAATRGNGRGQSFIDHHGVIFYVQSW